MLHHLHPLSDLKHIRGKRALVRVDFNTPVLHGKIHDDTRIRAALPTVQWLIKKGAKVIVMTHFGRPHRDKRSMKEEQADFELLALHFEQVLKKKVVFVSKWDFLTIKTGIKSLKPGAIMLLPNLRIQAGEEKNNRAFATQLAELGDFYVNEAFSVSHRRHASVVGVPEQIPGYEGLQFAKEIRTLGQTVHHPARPFIALMGGGKITDKIATLKTLLKSANTVLLGGALATHFFKAMGYGVGDSRIEPEGVRMAKELLKSKKIVLPLDVVVGTTDGKEAWVVEVPALSLRATAPEQSSVRGYTPRSNLKDRHGLRPRDDSDMVICHTPYAILDIGPKTILEYARHIKTAKTLIWNGPMGMYEIKRFSHGTIALGRLFAARSKGKAFGVIGGGETIDAMKQTKMEQYIDFVSTGGGAMLDFFAGKKLPGLLALETK